MFLIFTVKKGHNGVSEGGCVKVRGGESPGVG